MASVRKKEILWFLGVTFGFSYALWLPSLLMALDVADFGFAPVHGDWLYGPERFELGNLLRFLGGLGPVVAAITVTWAFRGQGAVGELLRRVVQLRQPFSQYLIAIFLVPVCLVIVPMIVWMIQHGTWTITWRSVAETIPYWLSVYVVYVVFIGCEQIGWCGFLLSRLQAKSSALLAALIVAVVWNLWHFPYYITASLLGTPELGIPPMHMERALISALIISLIPLVLFVPLMTWVYNSSRGSIAMVMLFHVSLNAARRLEGLAGESDFDARRALSIGLLILLGVLIGVIWRYGRRNLSTRERFVID
ncbi:MAG: CPBP family intramembrane glutamic endopeptidase [Acidobacteriota bacterium]